MNPKTFLEVQISFWIWVMIGGDKAKKRVLHTERMMVEDNHLLSDIESSANRMLSDFRALNTGIVHSDIYCDWVIRSKMI